MSKPVELLLFKGSYPIEMKREFIGQNMEGEHYEHRVYMYLGAIRLDITDKKPDEVNSIVKKLELMGLTSG